MGKRIDNFLKTYSSDSTKHVYRYALDNFFECIGTTDDKYFKEERDYQADIKEFFAEIKGRPPKTVKLCLSAVRTFLIENGVDLPTRFWRNLRKKIKGKRALTLDRVPTNEELKQLITHMDAKGTALFLMLASSGMRIGEALQIKVDDIDLKKSPGKISISGEYTKTGESRIAFISREAKDAVEEWLKEREDYLKSAAGRSRYDKPLEDDRLFPFEYSTAHYIWKEALKKCDLHQRDNHTNRHKIHPHVLRKFFRTQMGTVIPRDIAEALMGHEGYLTEIYRRYTMKQLADFYKRGERSIIVFEDRAGYQELKEQMDEQKKTHREIINEQAAKIQRLESQIAEMEQSTEQQMGEQIIQALNDPEIGERVLGALRGLEKKGEGGE